MEPAAVGHRVTGAHVDPEGDWKTGLHVLIAKAGLAVPSLSAFPLSLDYEPQVLDPKGPGGIWDQHDAGSCTGEAKGSSLSLRMLLRGTPIKKPSAIAIYNAGLRIDRIPHFDGSMDDLVDNGVASNKVTRALAEWGCCSAETWDGDAEVSSAKSILEPTAAQLSAFRQFKAMGAYAILRQGENMALDIMTALINKFPVEATVYADDLFQKYTGGIIDQPWDENTLGGWHRVYVCGYTWDGKSLSSFVPKLVNSWSPSWGGERGFFRLGKNRWQQFQDLNVQDVTTQGAEV